MASQATTASTSEAAMVNEPSTSRARPQRPKPNFPRPVNNHKKGIPKPAHLTNKETNLTNDPLWKDSFILDGETGFTNEEPTKDFHPDAAGYVHLVEAEYKAISDVDRYYSKSVSASAHAYYHHILLWYKLALQNQKRGLATPEEERLIRFVEGYTTAQIAAGAGEYLTGLGDYSDAMGVKHYLVGSVPNIHGHFGRANAQTHSLYEMLPAPAVLLGRVQQDMLHTTQRGEPDNAWVPPNIAPQHRPQADEEPGDEEATAERRHRRGRRREAEEGVGEDIEGVDLEKEEEEEQPRAPPGPQPTVNLLGWIRPTFLTPAQVLELSNIIVEDEEPQMVIHNYRLVRELFELVERKLRECKRYKLTAIPRTTMGSIVQQVIPLGQYGRPRPTCPREYGKVPRYARVRRRRARSSLRFAP